MKINRQRYGTTIHFDDTDDYEVTDDNGVDIHLSNKQLSDLITAISDRGTP
jgi:hypothetical protein